MDATARLTVEVSLHVDLPEPQIKAARSSHEKGFEYRRVYVRITHADGVTRTAVSPSGDCYYLNMDGSVGWKKAAAMSVRNTLSVDDLPDEVRAEIQQAKSEMVPPLMRTAAEGIEMVKVANG